MKLATVITATGTALARIDGDRVTVIDGYEDVGQVLVAGALEVVSDASGREVATDSLTYAALVPSPSKVVCVGLNYRAHILEMKRDLPDHPVLFAKFADTLAAAGETLALPPESDSIDWEGELVVVIGRTVRRADEDEARAAIAGYTIANDVSMRDWQFRTREWLQGKLWDRSTPIGPVLATPDEIPDDAYLTTSLDGEVVQRGDIHDLVHDPVHLVRYVSTITTLRPGDLILTGTPGGVGHARDPQRYLTPGSTVTVTIDGIGSLTNTFQAEDLG